MTCNCSGKISFQDIPALGTVLQLCPRGQSRGEGELSCAADHAMCHGPQGPIGLLGHQCTLLTHGHPVVNHWSTVGQLLVNRWLLWLLGHSAGLWSTRGQLLVNHWSTGTTLAFIAAWVHSWFVVNLWPTVGQPLVNWDSTGTALGHHWDTTGLCGHRGTL